MDIQLSGIHHVTAITAQAAANRRFYNDTLGLRLVKKTVNQDDTSAYHLFYADGKASPGTDLTFFDWPTAPERRGTHSISRTGLRVSGGEKTLDWWQKRLSDAGVKVGAVGERDGRMSLAFEDPEGQRLLLVDDGAGETNVWEQSPVPAEFQIRGLGPVMISVPVLERTEAVLTQLMGMREVRTYTDPDTPGATVHVFSMGEGGPRNELHVAVEPDAPMAMQGAGGVHHIAFRTSDAQYDAWAKRLNELRVPNSGKVNRYYFRSLYFREPNGILFEIASDGPGFTVDEPLESLGERLSLPPFLEGQRSEIEAGLKPL